LLQDWRADAFDHERAARILRIFATIGIRIIMRTVALCTSSAIKTPAED
jgi:hypothetical protein